MTRGDILLIILIETTGKPEAAFKPAFDKARVLSPDNRLDEVLPDD